MFSTNFHTKTIPSRWTGLLTYLLFVLFIVSCNPVTSGREIDKSKLYLEQTLAGLEPEIFAPGIISLEGRHEECPVFSPDSTEFYFTVWEQPEPEVFHTILYTTLQNGKWTKPEVAPFSQAYSNHCPTFSPDGQTLFFVSTRPPEPGAPPSDDTNLWLVTRTEEGWSEPKILPAPVNSEAGEYRPSVTADGTLYFLSHRASGRGQADLYRALLTDGGSWIVENLGAPINTKYEDGAVSIAPDGSYLIMVAFYADQTPPFNGDLYLSFSTQDDTWTTPTRIDWPGLNTSANEYQPMLSPDGKYLFFARSSGYPSGDIYWVDMRALEKFLAPPATADVEEVQVYLDQTPPGLEPEVFAPRMVSINNRGEFRAAFSPDGREFYFSITTESPRTPYGLLFTEQENGGWTDLAPPSFFEAGDLEPFLSPDGQRLYFTSNRPPIASDEDYNLWVVEQTEAGWSEPKLLAEPINTTASEWYASETNDGTLYFASERDDGEGGLDIYFSEPSDGQYSTVENIGDSINTIYEDFDAYINPEEKFMIFCSSRPGGQGGSDLYISFRQDDGAWIEPVNMDEPFNTYSDEFAPSISPDGKYFFFNRWGNLYWVDAKALDEFISSAVTEAPSDK
jgi:Tol biopolymer transport system component